jgi:hypothetical protein
MSNPVTVGPVPPREVEGILNHTRQLVEHAAISSSKLYEIRRRLTGLSDPQTPPTNNNIKEVITGELAELRVALDTLHNTLGEISRYTEALERV